VTADTPCRFPAKIFGSCLSGDPIGQRYTKQGKFEGGKILGVAITAEQAACCSRFCWQLRRPSSESKL